MESKAERFFWLVTQFPKTIISFCLIFLFVAGSLLPKMKIDTSIEAYIPKGHESLVNREKVREIFGLTDPIVVAISNDTPNGSFTPETLNLITSLTEKIQKVEGVDPDHVTSLATENNIYGTDEGLVVEPFISATLHTQEEAENVKLNVLQFPLYVGNLVSEDGTTTLIVAELLDKNKYGPQAYNEIRKIADDLTKSGLPYGTALYVAGEGGVIAHLAEYIDTDAKKMTPMAFMAIILVLILSYRTFRGLYLSVFVILGAVIGAMGLMAAFGVPMYQVSNVIPVILIAISVADAIHILGQYYENLAKEPSLSNRGVVVKTMSEMWRPVTITSVTDVVGFLAMGFTSANPPLQMVGIFSSVGVLAALVFSIFLIPAILVLLKPVLSKAFLKTSNRNSKTDAFGRLMGSLGKGVVKRPGLIMGVAAFMVLTGIIGLSQLRVDDASINNFNSETEIYQADQLINSKMDGANSLDVMVQTPEQEGLYVPERLKKIEALQRFIEQQPNVGGTTSIVDLLKQMNRSLNENKAEAYAIPEDPDLVAQYFLLYSASGDPSDFEQYVDYDYKLANISVSMKDGHYSKAKPVIEAVNQYITREFNDENIQASVAGWMNVFYYWVGSIGFGHFLGVIFALILVWAITGYSFKSSVAGIYAVVPVFIAVLFLYAVMGFWNITLNTATSMFAPIAVGVAVDFAVHLIDRIIFAVKEKGLSLNAALEDLFPSTGRALLFNVSAVALGFGSNMISSIPPFIQFGLLITVCVATSFLASVTLLPAMIKVFRPSFITKHENGNQSTGRNERLLEVEEVPV